MAEVSVSRRIAVVVTTMLTVPAAAIIAGLAVTFYTGCAIGCPDGGPQHNWRPATAAGAIAVLLLVAGPLLATRLTHSRRWIAIACVLPAALVIGVVWFQLARN